MTENLFAHAAAVFIEHRSPENAYAMIDSAREFVARHAFFWRNNDLSISDKIREIMSELFLILLEDFAPQKVNHPNSILKYLNLRLMRLTRPSQKRETSVGLSENLSELGRINIDPLRHQLAEEIFMCVRQNLAQIADARLALLEFLFIHVYPEVAWASRLIAKKYDLDPGKCFETDKKRHSKFNERLRNSFKNLDSGDWRQITEWSAGERSHLAWRIIDITIAETSEEALEHISSLEKWRETIDRRSEQGTNNLDTAATILEIMQQHYRSANFAVAEESAAPYGETSNDDILLELIGPVADNFNVAQESEQWEQSSDETVELAEYEEIAAEIRQWAVRLLKSPSIKSKKSLKNSYL